MASSVDEYKLSASIDEAGATTAVAEAVLTFGVGIREFCLFGGALSRTPDPLVLTVAAAIAGMAKSSRGCLEEARRCSQWS